MRKKRLSIYAVIFLGLLVAAIFVIAWINRYDAGNQPFVYSEPDYPLPTPSPAFSSDQVFSPGPTPADQTPSPGPAGKSKIILEVPYVSEAPSGNFSGPWKNACEEASITMVEKYYLDKKSAGIREAEDFMIMLFDKEDILYGSNKNTDAAQTAEIINGYSSYNAVVITDPAIEEIKKELEQNRPVISLHRGFDLQNENITFRPAGSSFHALVIIGYDDETQEFVTNDSGDRKEGAGYRYGYDLFMASLHDYNYPRDKADGPARVIFTSPKI
ncbi:MAG: C39 family peptidase [bacterium]|nr:C39 family peptidase [bacterium]